MLRLLNVSQAAFNLSYDLDKVIHIQTSARRTRHNGDAPGAKAERFHDLPGDAHLFLRVSRQGNANRVSNPFMQKNSQTDRRLYGAGKCCTRLSHAQMKWIIDFFGEETVSGNCAMK